MSGQEADISSAESLWKSGQFLEAWETTEQLPPARRGDNDVMDVRLRLCIGLEKWDLGMELSNALAYTGVDEHCATVADYYHALAAHCCALGQIDNAKGCVNRAAVV